MIATTQELAIEIGAMPILVRTDSLEFMRLLAERYGAFASPEANAKPVFELEIELVEPGQETQDSGPEKDEEDDEYDKDLSVRVESGRWVMERGDFHAELNPEGCRGWVRQTANPYSLDGVLRILHSLLLAREGGFLVHAAGTVRNGRAYLFAGVSGAGKTTISRFAPPDVTLLTDEISYVRKDRRQETGDMCQVPGARCQGAGGSAHQPPIANPKPLTPNPHSLVPAYLAFGTPFAGELARIGENVRAPIAALYLLAQGPENRVEAIGDAEAARALFRHILFFAQEKELVRLVFQSVLDFVGCVPVKRLIFTPDVRVWELII